MEDKNVLFKIKSLENLIARTFIKGKELNNDKLENKKITIPSSTQMQILEYILEHIDEDVYQKELEDVLNLRRATVSGVLQTMEKNNLIKRETDTVDTRTKKIVLNDEAKKMFLRGKVKVQEIEKIAIKGISSEELNIFINVIEKMKDNINNQNEN